MLFFEQKLNKVSEVNKPRGSGGGGENLLCHGFFANHMEVVMLVPWIISAIISICIVLALIAIGKKIKNFVSNVKVTISKINNIETAMGQIAESKRLSTILTIEAKKDLDIKPEDFEPKKEELRASMHSVLEEKAESYRRKNGKIGDPDTVAFVVLNHSGFDQFVDSDVRSKAKNALARLIANQDLPAAKRFLTTLARNL